MRLCCLHPHPAQHLQLLQSVRAGAMPFHWKGSISVLSRSVLVTSKSFLIERLKK